MKLYSYDGPRDWKASTRAESEKKARCNLAYKFKMETGRVPRTKITVPGKLVVESEDNYHARK